MRLRPTVLSRSHYVEAELSHISDDLDGDNRRVAEKSFDRVARVGNDHHPDDVLAGFLEQLADDFVRVKRFVDKNVAHRDRVGVRGLTWGELDTAIDNVEARMNEVGVLLTGVHHAAAPRLPRRWPEAFKHLFER